jgi:hypothetical protein
MFINSETAKKVNSGHIQAEFWEKQIEPLTIQSRSVAKFRAL